MADTTSSAQAAPKINRLANVSLWAAGVAVLGALVALVSFGIYFALIYATALNPSAGQGLVFVAGIFQRILMFAFWVLTPVGGLAAAVTGGIALFQINRDAGQAGKKRAVIGMVVGVLVVLVETCAFCGALFKLY